MTARLVLARLSAGPDEAGRDALVVQKRETHRPGGVGRALVIEFGPRVTEKRVLRVRKHDLIVRNAGGVETIGDGAILFLGNDVVLAAPEK
jgi:hypothetical protein